MLLQSFFRGRSWIIHAMSFCIKYGGKLWSLLSSFHLFSFSNCILHPSFFFFHSNCCHNKPDMMDATGRAFAKRHVVINQSLRCYVCTLLCATCSGSIFLSFFLSDDKTKKKNQYNLVKMLFCASSKQQELQGFGMFVCSCAPYKVLYKTKSTLWIHASDIRRTLWFLQLCNRVWNCQTWLMKTKSIVRQGIYIWVFWLFDWNCVFGRKRNVFVEHSYGCSH